MPDIPPWTRRVYEETMLAERRIREHIRETPLELSPYLSRETGARVYLKLENVQITGSFKLRGAFNKILSLDPAQAKKGVLTSSTGNHGTAVAYSLQKLGLPGSVYMPENAAKAKVETVRQYGIEPSFHGQDCMDAEIFARKLAEKEGKTFVSPYNDMQVIGGQGTVALELATNLEQIDQVLVPVGGGGLISGIAGYLNHTRPATNVVGCIPANSPVMSQCIEAGKITNIECLPTLSDATAGNMEADSVTFDICKETVRDFITVSEAEIRNALRLFMEKHYMLIEGAAALPIAALLQAGKAYADQVVVLVISGCKISMAHLKEILGENR